MTFFNNNFLPYSNVIMDITNDNPAMIRTLVNHGYHDGLVVRFDLPKNCGMQQMDGTVAIVTYIDARRFTVPIDTTGFDVFFYENRLQAAQVIPIAEQADSLTQATKNAKNIIPEY